MLPENKPYSLRQYTDFSSLKFNFVVLREIVKHLAAKEPYAFKIEPNETE